MKVALLNFIEPKIGGVTTYTYYLLKYLNKNGIKADYFVLTNLKNITLKKVFYENANYNLLSLNLFDASCYDVIHFIDCYGTFSDRINTVPFYFPFLKSLKHENIVLTLHLPATFYKGYGKFWYLFYGVAKKLLFANPYTFYWFYENIGFKDKKITFIPLPISLDDVDLTKQCQKTNDVLITSRFNSMKRIDDLVFIANKINNKFVLASLLEGLLAYKLKNNPFFKELVTQGKIILLGGFKYSELEKVYKPYKYLLELMDFRGYKGGGVLYTILEAMKYKVIPILMKGYEPWIQEGENYIALNKIDELPEKLKTLTKEQEEEIINNNLLFLTINHEANKVILKYKAFYET